MDKSKEIAFRFRQRAEELRAIASDVQDTYARNAMFKWAEDYERLAERAIELGTFGISRKPEPPRKT